MADSPDKNGDEEQLKRLAADHEQLLLWWRGNVSNWETRVSRFILGGNGAGAVLSIGLIGSYTKSSECLGQPNCAAIPTILFFMIMIFIIGLASAWLETAIWSARASRIYERLTWTDQFYRDHGKEVFSKRGYEIFAPPPEHEGWLQNRLRKINPELFRFGWTWIAFQMRRVATICLLSGTVIGLLILWNLTGNGASLFAT